MNNNTLLVHASRIGYPGKGVLSLLFFCSLAVLWVPTVFSAAAKIPTPSWMETAPVANTMIINGLPSTVHFFKADRKLDDLFEYYRRQWRGGSEDRSAYREVDAAPWHVIAKLDGRYLLTVQARSKDSFSSEGYLAVGDLKAYQGNKERGGRVPKMKGSKVLNDLTSYDPGKKGRTLLVVNTYSVESNSEFYRKHYLSRGWGQIMDQGSENARVLAFRRFGKEAHLVISSPGERTSIVMNLFEGD